jgi:DNA topoisomerase III
VSRGSDRGGRARGDISGRQGQPNASADSRANAALSEEENAVNRKGEGTKGQGKKKASNKNNDAPKSEDMMERKQQGAGGGKNKVETDSKKQNKAKENGGGAGAGKKAAANKMAKNDSSSAEAAAAASPLVPSIPPSQPQQTSDINYGRGQSITVLHVAEKPSIAQAVAQGLCRNGQSDYRSKSLPVHEFSCDFPKAPHARHCLHKVTSVAGHVFSVDFPEKYQSWDSVDPAELFHAPIVRKPCKGSVVKHLQDEAKGCDFIVLWLDCDREGENISFEVLDCCMHNMKSSSVASGDGSNFDRVYRAYFSAINPSDIQKAYHSLGKPDKNQSLSVDARQELDLKVGVAFSRFQTRFFQGRYGDLNSAVLSYGPCQTPTLGFCVQRHIDIETFKPEPFWVLELGVIKRGRKLQALWTSGRSFNKNKVERLLEQARANDSTVIVTDVVTKDKKQGRPSPMNTVALLKACSKALGIGPQAAMQAAERLYLSGYLSYPRTESTAYPNSFDIRATLSIQKSDNRWGSFVQALLRDGHNKPRGGVDKGGTVLVDAP